MLKRSLLTLIIILSALSVHSQEMPQGASGSVNALMMRLFEDQPFTATAHVKMTNKVSGVAEYPMNLSFSGEKLRAEIDITKMKNAQLQGDAMAQVKALGMDKLVNIVNKTTKTTLLLYPGLKASLEMPLPKEEAEALDKDNTFTKTTLGKEKFEGQETDKEKYVFAGPTGKKQELIVWKAPKLKGFPIRILMNDDQNNVEMVYRDIKQLKPEASLFEVPADYEKLRNMAQMQQVMMKRMMESVNK
jgi:hypothetical protein